MQPASLSRFQKLSEAGAAATRYTSEQRIEKFWARVDKAGPLSPQDGTPCWLWGGATDQHGYGQLGAAGGRKANKRVRAHRFAYELLVGPVGEAHLDHRHTCPKNCVNPDHLRPTTVKQNLENRAGPTSRSTTGVLGVTWNKRLGRYLAYANHHQKQHYGGVFKTLEEAEAADIALRNRLFTHNDRDRA